MNDELSCREMFVDYICGRGLSYVIDDTNDKACFQPPTNAEVEPQLDELRFAKDNDEDQV